MSNTFLARANQACRDKAYVTAASLYRLGWASEPGLAHIFVANLKALELKLPNDRSHATDEPDVDVIVPIHNALGDLRRALPAIEATVAPLVVRVTAVNDASNGETREWLRRRCSRSSLYRLIECSENVGYTKAVNLGLQASAAPYVVALNSDTIVTPGWLGGLIRCMESGRRVGIVGPISNAAGWQSVPHVRDSSGEFAANSLPDGYSPDDMAVALKAYSARNYPRVPMINGFCFMIKREVIERIGFMDEMNFPVGYGEESDYCIRAGDAGFECAIADDVYVYHAKSKSFGAERRRQLSELGSAALRKKHTREKYHALLNTLKLDPTLAELRTHIEALYQCKSASRT